MNLVKYCDVSSSSCLVYVLETSNVRCSNVALIKDTLLSVNILLGNEEAMAEVRLMPRYVSLKS